MTGLWPGGPDGVGVLVGVGELARVGVLVAVEVLVGVGRLARVGVLVAVSVLVGVGELARVGVLVAVSVLVGVGELARVGVLVAVEALVGVAELAKVGVLVRVGKPGGALLYLPNVIGSHTDVLPARGTTVAGKGTWPGVPVLKGCIVEAKETWLTAIVERSTMPEISSRPEKTERRAFIRDQFPPLLLWVSKCRGGRQSCR